MARWDGVVREVAIDASTRIGYHEDCSGVGPGISLEAVAVKADGRVVLRRQDGVAMPDVLRPEGKQQAPTPLPLERPFTNPDWMGEGVSIALAPLLSH
jgi:hypothetical protein